jgi:hypothetical protein
MQNIGMHVDAGRREWRTLWAQWKPVPDIRPYQFYQSKSSGNQMYSGML